MLRIAVALLGLLLAAMLIACGDDDDDNGGAPTSTSGTSTTPGAGGGEGGGADINVELVDFSIVGPAAGTAGEVTFNIENTGPEHAHEFVVIKTDLDAASLPTADDGSVDETASGVEVVDEVEEIEVGGSETLNAELAPGHYALICNVVAESEGETLVHYDLGMHMDFSVD
jgi:hypothetical protein